MKAGRTMLFVVLLVCFKSHGQQKIHSDDKLIFEENFAENLNTNKWLSEIEPLGKSSVQTKGGKLIMDTAGGVTVWFNQKLEGNIRIEYDWKVLVDTGRNDRLSDLNQFWMVADPRNSNLFTRSGKFETYDSLALYYVGFGGNGNTTTRFRKYYGDGRKPLLKEYLDSAHLLKPNHTYHISITVRDGETTFLVDGKIFFQWKDPDPLKNGYFGFRSTSARQAIDHFRVYRLTAI
ncbi:DUF6250 domain-containing protein [Dyadobacter sp. CY356]|uniref:DUF6250 domain-containing protein n=1 Tax=Dyadobacter sp. CY356 TaxID=2906442 RepID=UPI001F213EEC|nr:DUF6250 domain-containing protein [Dyadobacter sp. CY356]